MSFLPVNQLLNSVGEFQSFTHTITYVDDITGNVRDVTIVAVTSDPTVFVSGNQIYGSFSEAFKETISYRTTDGQLVTVSSFSDIVNNYDNGIYNYEPDPVTLKTYSYIATANNGDTQTYNIEVYNNWDKDGRNLLIALGKYTGEEGGFIWINQFNEVVIWVNDIGTKIGWTQ